MPQFTWVFDAPTGSYKNHALSGKIRDASIEVQVFAEHITPEPNFGRNRGETVTITRVQNITEPTDITLSETQRIPEDPFTVTTASITVVEIGRGVSFTSFSDMLSHFDIENWIQKKLRNQLSLGLDTKIATAFKTTKIKYAVTGAASNNITTNGTFGAASTDNMSLFHVEEIRDFLFDTLHVPMIGDTYVGIFRTLGLRGIKRDPNWEEWQKYTNPQAKYNSEIGQMEEVRFVETNHNNALGKVGTGSVLGEGLVFGEDAVAMAEVFTPELRMGIPQDLGRSHFVGWYGILEYGVPWDTGNAGEAKILHVGST